MKDKREPTNSENVTSRLFLRFFLAYIAACPIAWLLAAKGITDVSTETVGQVEFFFIPLALLGAILILSKPYLLLLSFFKGFFDAVLLFRVTQWTKAGLVGLLSWNACFCLIVFSLLLFALASARAQFFSFANQERDLKLLRSGGFWLYLFEALFFLALAFSLYELWPRLFGNIGILPTPFQ
ncbi:MAG: hypothetical protein E7585_00330 [Ruminococcaceae bacterium]|nr:hypothetical protein [Oscillospiraceae bacterium]